MNTEIGGYFELELPPPRGIMHDTALRFQSARAAFLALLRARKPKRVWMPHYICDAMLAPITSAGIELNFYTLDKNLGIIEKEINLSNEDILYYVNYFGICSTQIEKIFAKFNSSQIVLDYSQAFFLPPRNCLATIYSPRKFFGLPDGGLLYTQLAIDLPETVDKSSEKRISHLIARLGGTARSGYVDYQLAEQSFAQFEPKRMSRLSNRIFNSIDFDSVRIKRNENFSQLHEALSTSNIIDINITGIDGPLCYPYISINKLLKSKLLSNEIFISTYWKDVASRAPKTSFDIFLAENCLPLPCDQRCGKKEIEKIIKFITDT